MSAALQRAIEQTDAVPVAIGYHAFKIGSMTRWRVFRDALLDGELNGGPATMVSLNAASREMPEWWSPDRRKVWRAANLDKPRYYHHLRDAYDDGQVAAALDRITADLETGKVVPA